MIRLIAYRLGEALVSLFLMSIVVFFLARVTGDPVAVLLGEGATKADKAALVHDLGLDRSLLEQYGIFLSHAVHGDLGRSINGDQSPALGLVLAAAEVLADSYYHRPAGVVHHRSYRHRHLADASGPVWGWRRRQGQVQGPEPGG